MSTTKTTVASNNVNLDGFLVDNRFVAAQPIANYYLFLFKGRDDAPRNQFQTESLGEDVELVSVYGGNYVHNGTRPKLTVNVLRRGDDRNSAYTSIITFASLSPVVFGNGVIAPKGSVIVVDTSIPLTQLYLIAKPSLLQMYGSFH